jgi:hypothetical protein
MKFAIAKTAMWLLWFLSSSLVGGSPRVSELNLGLGPSLFPEVRVYEHGQPSKRVVLTVPVQINWGEGDNGQKNLKVVEGQNPFPAIKPLADAMVLDEPQHKMFCQTVRHRPDFSGGAWQHRVFVLLLTAMDSLLIPHLVKAAIGHSPGAQLVVVTNGFRLGSQEEERLGTLVSSASADGSRLTLLSFPHEFVGHALAINAAVERAPVNSIVAILPRRTIVLYLPLQAREARSGCMLPRATPHHRSVVCWC